MLSRVLIFSAVTMISLGGLSALAQQDEPVVITDDIPTLAAYSPEYALIELAGEYDLWVEAVLKHNTVLAAEREKRVITLISHDILISQDRVRELAKKVALVSPENDSVVVTAAVSEVRALFKSEIANLNSKEAIFRSIKKSTEFGQKYRLVGDNLDLVRRDKMIPVDNRAEVDPTPADGKK